MLYLIPVPLLPESDISVLSPQIPPIVQATKIFFVEEIRTARRFMRKCGYMGDFSEILFFEIKSNTPSKSIRDFLEKSIQEDICLLSESGMPCIADPGASVVYQAHRLKIPVHPLPGPNSILLTLAGSGFNGQNFVFHGYLPIKQPELSQKISQLESEIQRTGATQLFIETPFRSQSLFDNLLKFCKEITTLCIGKSLGTEHENISTHSIAEWKKINPQLQKQPAVFALGQATII